MEEKKIKIILVIADSNLSGGPAHVLGLLKNLDQKQFAPYLICPAGNLSKEAKSIEGVVVFNVAMKSKFALFSALKIRKTIEKIEVLNNPFSPLIVHSHGVRAGFLARLFYPKNAILAYTEHLYTFDYHLDNPINEIIQKAILKSLNKRTSIVIAVSRAVADFLQKSQLSTENKTVVIPNGIDIKNYKSSHKKIKTDSRSVIIGTVGSLNKQKGQRHLILAMPEILKSYPLARLEIVGKGSEEKSLRNLVKKLGIGKNVSFLGQLGRVEEFYRKIDLFVLPSLSETFGIVVLEAMRQGVPVVATSVGGVKDIIKNSVNGILVKSADEKAIAKAVTNLLDHPILMAKIRREALKRVEDFSWQKVIKQIEKVYTNLVENDEKDFS